MAVLMLSLTSINADAQRRRGSSGGTVTIEKWLVLDEGGYTNLRATPGGRVISKVRDGSWIWLNPDDASKTWVRTYTSSGQFRGYIHSTKIDYDTWGHGAYAYDRMVSENARKRVRVNK